MGVPMSCVVKGTTPGVLALEEEVCLWGPLSSRLQRWVWESLRPGRTQCPWLQAPCEPCWTLLFMPGAMTLTLAFLS